MNPLIYLDNSATTPVRTEVKEAMLPYLEQEWGNASSIHKLGRTAHKAVEVARKQIATLLNCKPEEVFFTPCGTYSNNVAILGRARFVEANALGHHIITCQIEHPSCLGPVKFLESHGWKATYLPVDSEGLIDPKALKGALTPDTSIIALMWANNEIGSLQPIDDLAAIAAENNIFFHTDAVQAAGKLKMDMQLTPISTLALSGHKFYAPKGIGVLYVRSGVNLMPLIFGGGQEKALFPGTEGVANIIAIGKAAELSFLELELAQTKLRRMQELLHNNLKAAMPELKVTGPCDLNKRLPGHLSFLIPDIEGEAVVMKADLQGLCISAASACHTGTLEPSHVIMALGIKQSQAGGSIRISAGRFNNEAECEEAVNILVKILKSNRKHLSESACTS